MKIFFPRCSTRPRCSWRRSAFPMATSETLNSRARSSTRSTPETRACSTINLTQSIAGLSKSSFYRSTIERVQNGNVLVKRHDTTFYMVYFRYRIVMHQHVTKLPYQGVSLHIKVDH